MREIRRSALVPYTPAQMFALVDDIERYPSFLPWVASTQLLERSDDHRLGSMTIARGGLQERIKTRNTVQPPQRLTMTLVEGPFKSLQGVWTFDAIGEANAPGQKEKGTKIGLVMQFEFKNRMTDLLFGKAFETSCDSLVDAFAKQAKAIYGKASSGS